MLIVGIAIVAFIIGDLTKNKNAGQFEIAKVGNATYTIQDFNDRYEELKNNYMRQQGVDQVSNDIEYRLREQVWESLVEDTIMGAQYRKLGLMISEDEANSMMYEDGDYTHQYMRQWFTDPSTGQYNAQGAARYFRDQFDQLDPDMQRDITAMKKEVENSRMQEKYNNLISKGFYVPTAMAEAEAKLCNNRCDAAVVMASYQSVSDENANPTEEDYQKYFNEHRAEIETGMGLRMYNEIRKIEYITYPIVPSEEDLKQIEEEVDTIWKEFQTVENANISEFVYGNSKPAQSYDTTYVKASQVRGLDTLLERTPVGGFIAPRIIGNNEWVMAKVMDVANRPDSIKASVVLLLNSTAGLESVTRTDEEAKLVADTVEMLLKAKNANIEDIVAKYSDDPQKNNNKGDMGWALDGTTYGFLNDDIIKTPEGGVFTYKRPDNLGYVVVKVTGKTTPNKKYRVAKISREIAASNTTSTQIFNKASWFIGQNRTEEEFMASASNDVLSVKEAMTTQMMNQLPGLDNCRGIMQWAFDKKRKVGDVSEEVYSCGDNYVIVTLKEIYNKKNLSVDKIRTEIEQQVRLEKRAEYLMAEASEAAKTNKNLASLATRFNTTVDTLTNVSFRDYYLGRFGMEPKVQAHIAMAKKDVVSAPVRGANGVYFVKVTGRTSDEQNNVETLKNMMARDYTRKASSSIQVLRNATKIKDNRYRFF